MDTLERRSRALLRGAVDLHMHTAPDIFPRSVDTWQAAEQARDAGMRAIVVKSHNVDTAARAELVRAHTGFDVFGGIALNYGVGGLNPHAVRESAWHGGREVWFPTIHARRFFRDGLAVPTLYARVPVETEPGLVAAEHGELLPPVREILALAAEHRLIVSTGHLDPEEGLAVLRAAREAGCDRLVVTHPHASFCRYSVEQMREAAALGAVLELHYAFTTAAVEDDTTVADLAAIVRAVGVERCVMATDGGQSVNPPPVELLRLFLAGFLELGFAEDELRLMSAEAPALLLGLTAGTG